MSLVVTLGVGHSLRGTYQAALPAGARLSMGPVGGFSARYAQLAREQSLRSFLQSHGWDGVERVALVCFSAGCWAPRQWMMSPQNRLVRPLALLLLDGLHGGSRAACDAGAISGITAFARSARSNPRERLLIVTNTDISPPYASTSACAELLLDQLRVARLQPDAGSARGVTVLDFGGTDAAAHNAQQTTVGPDLLRGALGRWLRGIYVAPVATWLWAAGAAVLLGLVGVVVVNRVSETA